MFDPFTLALIGGGIGALTNKKNPLQGAMMGGALGGAGGLLAAPASAASGAAGATGGLLSPSAYTGTAAELAADGLGGVAMQPTGFDAAMSGAKGFADQAKPYLSAVNTASQVAGQFAPQKMNMPAPNPMTNMPNNNLGQLVASNEHGQQNQMAQAEQQRAARRQKWGNNGLT